MNTDVLRLLGPFGIEGIVSPNSERCIGETDGALLLPGGAKLCPKPEPGPFGVPGTDSRLMPEATLPDRILGCTGGLSHLFCSC